MKSKLMMLFMIGATLIGSACAKPLTAAAPQMQDGNPTIAAAPIHLFRNTLSRADGHRCPMNPSCSSYALTAMQRHGALMGWIMACDRLLRCGRDELKYNRAAAAREGAPAKDSVENNDFWWN